MLTLQQIIDEVDKLIPNLLTNADKVTQLNAINQDFFNVVKIPKLATFAALKGQATYTLAHDVRAKNIDYVKCGLLNYRDMQSDNVRPTDNVFSFDDATKVLTLSPAPYQLIQGFLRYHRIATSTFTGANLSAVPDAPAEYHGSYITALAAWIALTQDELVKASVFESQYKATWNAASQNYQQGG
jgi:hypothetical protein